MTFPFPFSSIAGNAVAALGHYTLVHLANPDDDSPTSVIAWDAEVQDYLEVHDNAVSNSKFIIPSTWNGRYARLTMSIVSTIIHQAEFLRGGATFVGNSKIDMTETSGDDGQAGCSAPILLATGQEYEVSSTSVGNFDVNDGTWFQLELLADPFDGAVVYKSGTQNISANTNTAITFNTEAVDTNGYHESVTNPSFLTVPSGVSLVRLSGGVHIDSSATTRFIIQIFKNGAIFRGTPLTIQDSAGEESVSIMTGPIQCSPGDDFELRIFTTTASVIRTDHTWFAIEALDPALQFCMVNRTSTQNIPGSSVPTAVDWDAEVADVGGWHDNTTDNNKIVVPTGVTRVRCTFGARSTVSTTSQYGALVRKNGSNFVGMSIADTDAASVDSVCGHTAILEVTPGDYFEMLVFATTASSDIGSDFESWFCVEESPNVA